MTMLLVIFIQSMNGLIDKRVKFKNSALLLWSIMVFAGGKVHHPSHSILVTATSFVIT